MTDEQPPIDPALPPSEAPPPPSHGPFAFPPPPEPVPTYGGPGAPRGFYPLSIGRVFELTWSIYRFHFGTMVAIGLVTMIPLAVLVALAQYYQVSSPDFLAQMANVENGGHFDELAFVISNLPLSLAYGLSVGMISTIGNGAFADAAARTINGAAVSAAQSLRRSIGKIVTWLGIYLVIFVAETGLATLGVVAASGLVGPAGLSPGVNTFVALIGFVALGATIAFLTIRWTFIGQAVMVESAGSFTALRRSWHLAAGSGWRVLGYLLAFGLLIGVMTAVVGLVVILILFPFRFTGTTLTFDPGRLALGTFLEAALSSFIVGIPTIALTLLFFDLRFRKGEQMPQPGERLAR